MIIQPKESIEDNIGNIEVDLPKESIEELGTGGKQVGSKLQSVGETKVMSGGGVPGQYRSDCKVVGSNSLKSSHHNAQQNSQCLSLLLGGCA